MLSASDNHALDFFLSEEEFLNHQEKIIDRAVKQTDYEIRKLIRNNNFRPIEFFRMFNGQFLKTYLKQGKYTRSGINKTEFLNGEENKNI